VRTVDHDLGFFLDHGDKLLPESLH
jgi:hypothetical protein